MRKVVLQTILTLMLGYLLTACAQNELILHDTWKNPEYSPRKCGKVLVVGISENVGRRILFEDAFSTGLRHEGINSLQGNLVMNLGVALSREKVVEAVQLSKADCVITTYLESIVEETTVIPGYDRIEMVYPDNVNSIFGIPTVVKVPSQSITDTKTTVETRLYESGTAKLIWATKGAAYNITNNAGPATKDYAKTIFKALKKEGLF